MKKLHSTTTVAAVLALFACGGSGPSGTPQEPGPGTLASGGERAIRSDDGHYESVIDMLRGKAPGLQVVETSPGQIEVRIRGLNQSMQGSGQEPLVVIDGAPSSRPAGQTLSALNPDDIDRIEVLKDVGSTSVYGTRGANGVILVTTKKRDGPRP